MESLLPTEAGRGAGLAPPAARLGRAHIWRISFLPLGLLCLSGGKSAGAGVEDRGRLEVAGEIEP